MRVLLISLFIAMFSPHVQSSPFAAEAAVYRIIVPGSNGIGSQGTGILVAPDKILTNCHVLQVGGAPKVLHRHSGREFQVKEYYQLGGYDACVLRGDFHGVPLRLVPNVQQGESIWVFGYPSSTFVAIQGTVKGYTGSGVKQSLLLAAFCSPGSSGGPVVNIRGELIGLQWGMVRGQNNNECLAIPSQFLQPYL